MSMEPHGALLPAALCFSNGQARTELRRVYLAQFPSSFPYLQAFLIRLLVRQFACIRTAGEERRSSVMAKTIQSFEDMGSF